MALLIGVITMHGNNSEKNGDNYRHRLTGNCANETGSSSMVSQMYGRQIL